MAGGAAIKPSFHAAIPLLLLLGPGLTAQVPQASVEIEARKIENRISPMLYGQFAEFMFEGVKGGLHAELIRNRGFEEPANAIGLSRFWEREPDDRNDDVQMRLHWDSSVFYPPPHGSIPAQQHSLSARIGEADQQRRGVNQPRIPVRAGLEYRGYLWLKGKRYEGHVTVALEQDRTEGETYASATVTGVADEWKKFEFTLKPVKSDPLAKLSILFNGRGTIWVDQVSLMPADAVGAVRADVFDKVKALNPSFIRWPGGNVAQDYHWMSGIGPRDQRPTWTNLSWWDEVEPSDFGTDEFIQFCRKLESEPSITVNVEGLGATAEEAAAWVQYVNGPKNSKYGRMRAQNGHQEPYRVKLWEVGNEIWGDWVRGHSDATTYANNYNRYFNAMRGSDPSIKLIAVGDNDMKWNETVLRIAGRNIDYLAIHHYYGTREMQGDPLNLMARPLFYEKFYREVERLMEQVVPGSKIKLAINEWNTSLPPPRQHSMESALYAARLMNVFERLGDLVEMTAVSDLVNGWPGGVIQASRHDVFVTPTYLVNKLYRDHLGTVRYATTVKGPTFDSSREGKDVPYLDVIATAEGSKIYVKAVNTDPQRPLQTTFRISGAAVGGQAEWHLLTAETLRAANSFRTPDAVSIRRSTLAAGMQFTVELPKHSVSIIVLERQNYPKEKLQ